MAKVPGVNAGDYLISCEVGGGDSKAKVAVWIDARGELEEVSSHLQTQWMRRYGLLVLQWV